MQCSQNVMATHLGEDNQTISYLYVVLRLKTDNKALGHLKVPLECDVSEVLKVQVCLLIGCASLHHRNESGSFPTLLRIGANQKR